MRYFAIIFSLFIVYLVSVPCVDEIVHNQTLIIENSTPQGSPCSHSEHDACTPFCVCACCGIVVVMNLAHFDTAPYLALEAIIYSFPIHLTSTFAQSFWQPPKLGWQSFCN